jgi:hypothetical protein
MRARPVVRDDGERYASIADAARAVSRKNVNGTSRNILQACQGKAATAYGHRWRYDDGEFIDRKPAQRRQSSPAGRYGISGMRLDHDEWKRFRRICDERGLLAREAGAQAVRMWMEAEDAEGR